MASLHIGDIYLLLQFGDKLRLTKQDIDNFLEEYNTQEKARKFLREAGFIDENGKPTKPYRKENEFEE